MPRVAIDMAGRRVGRLIVLERDRCAGGKNAQWRCRCDCGNVRTIRGSHLRRGETRSCGCIGAESLAVRSTTHGVCGAPEYRILIGARHRCMNPADKRFKDYGGRGIEYRLPADVGEAYRTLIEEIGPRPSGQSLDRIDNDGHYESGNLRWATWSQQARNRRRPGGR